MEPHAPSQSEQPDHNDEEMEAVKAVKQENVQEFKPVSNKAAKKEAKKLEKQCRRQEAALSAATSSPCIDSEEDPLAANYGDVPLLELQSKTVANISDWTKVEDLKVSLENNSVLIQGRVQNIRAAGKKMAFLVIRENGCTVQCVVLVKPNHVSRQMVKYATSVSRESFVEIGGIVSVPKVAIKGASQQVEIQVCKLHCVSRAVPTLPINVEDAARSENEIQKALQAGKQLARVNQDARLNNRVLDLRTPANQGIFSIQSQVGNLFAEFLLSEGFVEIHTPKLLAGASDGGAAVFTLDYMGQPASLAQSPQLHKQMSICAGFGRVFEICPAFRAENSFTHRHLCEFTQIVAEMEIKRHYVEVMDLVDRLFVAMFDGLNNKCKKDLEAVGRQYPFQPLKYLRQTLQLTFEEGIQMLKEAGIEVNPLKDLNTEAEKKLGRLVLEKYGTDFYILHRYPLIARPFFTMPCHDNQAYSNSFDAFIRGEEIISGAQRIHRAELLEERAKACGVDVNSIAAYIDSFRYGTPPHGGFGAGLERVVMLFCGLDNIRKASLFPRDPCRMLGG